MTDYLYMKLKEDWRRSNHAKYQHYFDEWVKNITETQEYYFNIIWQSDKKNISLNNKNKQNENSSN